MRRLHGPVPAHTFARANPLPTLLVMQAPPSLSLERKLPLLISVFLVSLASGLTGAGYHEVKQASELRGLERMQRLTGSLAQLAATSTDQRYAALRRVAADTSVVRYLAGSTSDSVHRRAALAALRGLSVSPTVGQ